MYQNPESYIPSSNELTNAYQRAISFVNDANQATVKSNQWIAGIFGLEDDEMFQLLLRQLSSSWGQEIAIYASINEAIPPIKKLSNGAIIVFLDGLNGKWENFLKWVNRNQRKADFIIVPYSGDQNRAIESFCRDQGIQVIFPIDFSQKHDINLMTQVFSGIVTNKLSH